MRRYNIQSIFEAAKQHETDGTEGGMSDNPASRDDKIDTKLNDEKNET